MKKTLMIFSVILALLLTTGCAAANTRQTESNGVMAAAESATDVVTDPAPIQMEDAQSIALDHADVSAADATVLKTEYDREDNKYDVEFRFGDYEYDYEIHADSGEILSHDKEYDAPKESKPVEATEATDAAKTLIGKDQAKAMALDHAGVSASDVRELEVDFDKDDGIPIYEVEFESGKLEYSYEIHGYTGKILSHEIDN